MRYLYLFFILPAAILLNAQNNPSMNHFMELVNAEKRAHNFTAYRSPKTIIDDYNVIYHRCNWEVDPAVYFIKGSVTTYFTPLTSGFKNVRFDLSNSLQVDSVIYKQTLLSFSHANDLLNISLPGFIPQNQLDSVTVFYHGAPPQTGFGSFSTGTHQGTPMLWTLSEPYGGSDWWPCKNGLSDKVDSLDVYIITPSNYRGASNGKLVSEITNGNTTIYHWKHRHPIATYLICLAATNYVQYSHNVPFGNTNTEVLNYIYPEDSASAVSQTPMIIPVMQLYDSIFGVYPFADEKYGHCEFGWGGGMEHQTFTFVGGFNFELIAHELAHHWFGDKITCGTWQDIWLNEGFATFLSGLSYEHILPQWWRQFKAVRIQDITSQPGGSVWCDDTTSVDRIFNGRLSYSKGCMIMNQLRWILGDSTFFKALFAYQNDTKLTYNFARTSDLIDWFETISGKDLHWYFNEWFTGQGYPSYQIGWVQSGDQLKITVSQTQSHPSVSFFELPLPIQLIGQNRDTLVRLDNTFSGQSYTLTIPFKVDSVVLDPDIWLIQTNSVITATDESTSSQLFSVLPNPAHDFIEIKISEKIQKPQINILNSEGKLIMHLENIYSASTKLNLKDFIRGSYFVQLNYKGQNRVEKFIVE